MRPKPSNVHTDHKRRWALTSSVILACVGVVGGALLTLVIFAVSAGAQPDIGGPVPPPTVGWDPGLTLLGQDGRQLLPGDAGDLIASPMNLSDVHPLSGVLMPDGGTGLATSDLTTATSLAEQGLMQANMLRLAEEAKRKAERERLSRLGFGQLGADVMFADLFNGAGAAHQIDPRLVAAVARQESAFRDEVIYCTKVSRVGARGIMQFMPSTAEQFGINPCVPEQAIYAGAEYLSQLHDQFGNWPEALAGYNAGPGNVMKYSGIPPFSETRAYVPAVLGFWDEYRSAYPSPYGDPRFATTANGEVCVQKAGGFTVNCSIADNVAALVSAAAADKVHLTGWGHRSHQRQIELRSINGCPDVWTASPSSCTVPTAIPGRSLHEQGLAIDFSGCTKQSACFRWLQLNAASYGLYNLPSESWHWSTTGR